MFKSVYTKRSKCSMFKAFEKIISLIINKSDADDESNIYQCCPAFNPYIKDKVLRVPASCFKLITKDKIVSYSVQVHKQTLRLDDIRCHKSLSCNCIEFVKWALCYHVVAYSHIKKYHWYGAEYRQSDNFVRKTKKGAHVKETKSAAGRHKKIFTALNY